MLATRWYKYDLFFMKLLTIKLEEEQYLHMQ
jgi:hypothetical protein